MRIIFMGSAGFAVPSLDKLVESDYDVIEIVCQPDKPAGRGRKITACPVASFAREHKLPLFQPETLKGHEAFERIEYLAPDLIVVVAYGKLLPVEILEIPQLGCINLHASLLPRYRGAAPINWAIINGEEETGVTTMFMNEGMDEGDILLARSVDIDEFDNAIEVEERLEQLGAHLLIETIKDIIEGGLKGMPQDNSLATYAPILSKKDGLIDWSQGAQAIANRVRGLVPWPVAHTHVEGKLLKIYEAHASDEPCGEAPGTVIRSDQHLAIATGEGVIYPIEVQIEGKKRMKCEDMLRGCPIKPGTRLT
jgi:methionyl-tRNA formyltransferase